MKRVQLLAGAQRDLAEAVAFYRERDERIVARFVVAIDRHLEVIAEHPERAPVAIGTKGPTQYRRLKASPSAFSIALVTKPSRSSLWLMNVAGLVIGRGGRSV